MLYKMVGWLCWKDVYVFIESMFYLQIWERNVYWSCMFILAYINRCMSSFMVLTIKAWLPWTKKNAYGRQDFLAEVFWICKIVLFPEYDFVLHDLVIMPENFSSLFHNLKSMVRLQHNFLQNC